MDSQHVTRQEFDNHLILIHESIRQSNERTDLHFTRVVDEVSLMRKSQDRMLDKLDKAMDDITPRINTLENNQGVDNAYWKLSGAAIAIVFAAVVGLAFDRLANSQQRMPTQQQLSPQEIRQ